QRDRAGPDRGPRRPPLRQVAAGRSLLDRPGPPPPQRVRAHVRLDPAEVPELPFPAALVDSAGAVVAATPEWQGPLPGSLAYHTGAGPLLIRASSPPPPDLDPLMGRLPAAP